MNTTERIAEWAKVCRMPPSNPNDTRNPARVFEMVVRDMSRAGFALPSAVIAGVRRELTQPATTGRLV